eukprot:3129763-Heterocapsa_arctica.AAC.1
MATGRRRCHHNVLIIIISRIIPFISCITKTNVVHVRTLSSNVRDVERGHTVVHHVARDRGNKGRQCARRCRMRRYRGNTRGQCAWRCRVPLSKERDRDARALSL